MAYKTNVFCALRIIQTFMTRLFESPINRLLIYFILCGAIVGSSEPTRVPREQSLHVRERQLQKCFTPCKSCVGTTGCVHFYKRPLPASVNNLFCLKVWVLIPPRLTNPYFIVPLKYSLHHNTLHVYMKLLLSINLFQFLDQ